MNTTHSLQLLDGNMKGAPTGVPWAPWAMVISLAKPFNPELPYELDGMNITT